MVSLVASGEGKNEKENVNFPIGEILFFEVYA